MEDIIPNSPLSEPNDTKKFPKTCIICFKTNNCKDQNYFFELWLADTEQTTLLEKLQVFLNEKLWVQECTVLCEYCRIDLIEAFNFRRRLLKSQEIWKTTFLPTTSNSPEQTQTSSNCIIKVEVDEGVNDITEIIEIRSENLKAEDLANNSLSYYSCKNCSAVFANNAEFSSHKCEQSEETTLQDTKEDSDVDSVFKTDTAKATKNTSKRKQKGTIFECDLCGKNFNNLYGRNRHKVKVHFQEKVFSCTFCNKSFKQKYHLKEHLTSHTGEKNYSCSICDKTFQRISSQRRHMRSHENAPGKKVKQTPFLCTVCGKSFPFSNGVQRHMRIHTGERRYECYYCGRKFMQSTHLQVHIRTHTGERPYTCHICGNSFSLRAALRKHLNCHKRDKK